MAKYVSNKVKELQVGVSDYSESKTSLEVVGAAVIAGVTTITSDGINVTGVITATSFSGGDGGSTGIIGDDIVTRNLHVSGITTFDNGDVVFQGASASQNMTWDASENDLEFTDLARLKFGDSDDLEIWHGSGNNSHIKNSTNDLKIRSDSLILKRADDSEPYLKATVNEDVKIYYNGNEKFATTKEGVLVSGGTTTGTLSVTGISTIGHLEVSASGIVTAKAGAAITYYGDGSNLTGIDATALKDANKIVRVQANTSGAFVTGVLTATSFVGSGAGITGLSIPGISTDATADLTNLQLGGTLKVTGLSTFSSAVDINADLDVDGHTELDDVNVSGALTATTIVGTSLTITGISTLGSVQVSSGIITTTPGAIGVITYYGDGQHLTGVATALNGNAVATTLKVSGLSTFLNNLEVSGIITAKAGAALTFYGDGSNLTGVDADTIGDLSKLKVIGLSTFAGITTVTNGTFFADTVSVSGVASLGKGASGSVEIYDTNNLKLKTTGLGISIASGSAKTAYIQGPEEIWIDPSPLGVGTTSGVVRIKGDLYVDGTNFIVDSETITLGDHKVGIASTVSDNTLLDGGGIGIGSANIEKTLTWNNASTSLKSSENFDLANTKSYKINGTDVVSADTLGSGVTISSLTSLGTIAALSATNSNVSGISSVGTGITMYGTSGIISATSLYSDTIITSGNVGIGTTIATEKLHVVGVVSATSFYGDGSNISNISADTLGELDHLVVTGITTLGNVKFETAGIVTAISGIVTYYGDGQNLTGIATALNGNAVASRLHVSGVSTFVGAVGFGTTSTYLDNAAIYFGDDNDLQIFHSGSHSWIEDTGTGNLVLKGSRIDIQDTSGNELLSAEGGQYVRLGYGATERLKTTSTGAVVTGVLTATTFEGDGSKLSEVLRIEDQGSSVGSSATTINFVGEGVSATYSNGISTVTIETTSSASSKWVTTDVGIHTLSNVGLGTTNPQTSLQVGDIYGVASGIGTWTAIAGIAHTINQYTIATNDFKTAEYTVHIGIGTKIQSQKVLVMQNGTTAYSQEYAVMYSNDLLVSIGSTIESGVMKLHVTPDTGINGLTTYRFSRQTML